jgi:hypothetical protein
MAEGGAMAQEVALSTRGFLRGSACPFANDEPQPGKTTQMDPGSESQELAACMPGGRAKIIRRPAAPGQGRTAACGMVAGDDALWVGVETQQFVQCGVAEVEMEFVESIDGVEVPRGTDQLSIRETGKGCFGSTAC